MKPDYAAAGSAARALLDEVTLRPLLTLGLALVFALPLGLGLSMLVDDDATPLEIDALVVYIACVTIVVWPGRRQLGLVRSLAAVLLMTLCVTLTYDTGHFSDGPWPLPWFALGLHAFLAVLALRQRPAIGWVMLAILYALAATHGARSEVGVISGILVLSSMTAVMVISQVVFVELERMLARGEEARWLGQEARDDDDAQQDTVNASIRRVQEVRRLAEPMLQRIAHDSAPITAEEIRVFRITEAQLRDSIRGRHVTTPKLLEAATAARQRGVAVDILDERGEDLPPALQQVVAEQGIKVLETAQHGSVTIRALAADDPTAAFIVLDPGVEDEDAEDAIAVEIDQQGGVDVF